MKSEHKSKAIAMRNWIQTKAFERGVLGPKLKRKEGLKVELKDKRWENRPYFCVDLQSSW